MIPEIAITQWRNIVPWTDAKQVEQDLIICRALIAIFSDDYLAGRLAFRGGTALHKLYLSPWKIQCKLPPKTKRFCPLVLK